MQTISHYLLTFLLNSLWQIPVVAIAAAVACRAMRNGPAAHRHAVWVAALVAAVLLPLASVRSADRDAPASFTAPAAPEATVTGTAASAASGTASAAGARRTISYGKSAGALVMGAYLLFVALGLARLGWAWFRTLQIRDRAGLAAAPALVRHVWERCLAAFELPGVELLASATVQSPVAAGAWRRTIILPQSLLASDSEEVLTTAIGHEMAHLARHDFAQHVLYQLVSAPVAFHPAVWLILRGIAETREMACDELVTRKLLDAGVYARSIMSIAGAMVAVPQPGYTLGVFDGDILERRIQRLLQRPVHNLKRARLMLAAGIAGLAVCVAIASGVAWTAQAQAQSPDRAEISARVDALVGRAMQEPQNAALQNEARTALLDALARDPGNPEALNGMMMLSIMMKQPEEARQWALKMVALHPNEKTSYYCVGFSDWSVVYPQVMAVRAKAGMPPQDQNFVGDAGVRRNLRDQYGPVIDEGMQMLEKAIQMDPQYHDAMAYLNLLYRMKANVVETPEQNKAAVAAADEWVSKALEAKRLTAGTPSRNGAWTATPPPPPPPPPPPYFSDTALASDAPMPAHSKDERRLPGTYWQVVGATEIPARKLIVALTAAGFRAGSMLTGGDGLVRVIVGPYSDEAAAAEARAKLTSAGYRVVRSW